MGSCACDITPDVCDNLCCCDPDCPVSIVANWKKDPDNVCVDLSKHY